MRPARTLVLGASLVALAVVAYAPLVGAGFVYEDLRWWHSATPMLFQPRGLMHASWWTQAQWTPAPWAFHFLDLTLHAIAAGLLGMLVHRLGASRGIAWPVAATFFVHPSTTEAAVYLSARPELIAAIGILSACVIAAGAWWRWPLIFIALGLGVLGKETSLVAIGLVPLVIVTSGSWRLAPRKAVVTTVIIWGCLVFACLLSGWQKQVWDLGEDPIARMDWWTWLLIQGTASLRSIALVVPGAAHTVDYDYDLVAPWARDLATGLFVSLAALAIAVSRRRPMARCGALWVLISLAPRFFVQTPRSYLNDHQFYVPLMGLMIFAAGLIVSKPLEGGNGACQQ